MRLRRTGAASPETAAAGYPHAPSPARSPTIGERAASVAVRQVGVPYRYGGSARSGFDCSGLVHFAYASAGKQVPRTTSELWRRTRPIGRADLQTGDLLFFRIEGKIRHVGLYLGEHRFVHAPSSGRAVAVADLDTEFYQRAFIRGGRLL